MQNHGYITGLDFTSSEESKNDRISHVDKSKLQFPVPTVTGTRGGGILVAERQRGRRYVKKESGGREKFTLNFRNPFSFVNTKQTNNISMCVLDRIKW